MRRPVMYIAGLMLATGASLALAGPASAHGNGDDYDLDYHVSSYELDYEDNDTNTQFSLINLLSPNGEGNQGLGLLSPFGNN